MSTKHTPTPYSVDAHDSLTREVQRLREVIQWTHTELALEGFGDANIIMERLLAALYLGTGKEEL
jgi:hypothetical protein